MFESVPCYRSYYFFFQKVEPGALCNDQLFSSAGHSRESYRDPYWPNPAHCPVSHSLPRSRGPTSLTLSLGVRSVERPYRPPQATWRPAHCHLQVTYHQNITFFLWKYFSLPAFFSYSICLVKFAGKTCFSDLFLEEPKTGSGTKNTSDDPFEFVLRVLIHLGTVMFKAESFK